MKETIEHSNQNKLEVETGDRPSFKELLRASFKSNDTEEWLDVHFTRPIGLAFALLWYRLGVTPNSITILSIFLGAGAGIMFYFTDTLYNIIGVTLLMLANFCDSTDGQLARLTNQRSMKGRCLDGLAGDIWFLFIYVAIVARLWAQSMPGTSETWGFWALALVSISGFLCHSPQSSLSDYYRQIHLYFLKGKDGSELDTYAQEHAIVKQLKGKKGVFWDRAFHSNYQNYCKSQERRTPAFQKFHATLLQYFGSIENVPSNIRERFLDGSRPLLPLTNLLTFNSRAILIYITCLLNCPWVYLLLEITLYNILYIYMHKQHESLCKSLMNTLSSQGQNEKKNLTAYLFDFGGTLDTSGCHWGRLLWHSYERHNVPVEEKDFRDAYIYAERMLGKNPIIQSDFTFHRMLEVKLDLEFDYLLKESKIEIDNNSLRQLKIAILDDVYGFVIKNITKSRSVLEALKKEHRLGLVTNFYGNMNVVLAEFHLSHLFETVTESAVVGVRKPNTEIFKKAVSSLELEPKDVTVVGDSLSKDIEPAHSIGCSTVWIKGEGWTDEEPLHQIADVVIKDLTELLQDNR